MFPDRLGHSGGESLMLLKLPDAVPIAIGISISEFRSEDIGSNPVPIAIGTDSNNRRKYGQVLWNIFISLSF